MRTPLVLTIIGKDRPGLVEALASAIARHDGNWLESNMGHLGGQFAGILSLDVAAEKREALIESFGLLRDQGLQIVVADSVELGEGQCHEVATIEIVGQDRPGIVSQISNAFAKHGVNVEELETECRSAPMSGEQLFEAKARVCIPAECDLEALRGDLELIAADLLVDVNFELSGVS